MSNVHVQARDIVTPGEILAEGMDYLPGDNTFRDGDKVCSKVLGLVNLSGRVLKVTALGGPYILKIGDRIIGKVSDILMSGWRIDTNTAYSAVLNVKDASTRYIKKEEDLSKILAIGDYAVVQITNVTSQNLIDITLKGPNLRKIQGGRITKINCHKVPRVIGKQGSMISLLKKHTGCEIVVGQNGLIWLTGTPQGELKAEEAIKLIEEKSHIGGLTEYIEKFLGEQK